MANNEPETIRLPQISSLRMRRFTGPFGPKSFAIVASVSAMLLSSCAQQHRTGAISSALAAPSTRTVQSERSQDYTISTEMITQPIDHRDLSKGTFEQQVIILRPDGAAQDADVLFMLGNETDSTPQRLAALYRNYGSPKDVVFITADHRGYGQSISDQDQSRPTYVTIHQAMADYDRLVRHYKSSFGGKWIGCGCSYGGALLINFAHDFPKHFSAIIASSAPTRFEFITPEYAGQARLNLGPKLADRLRLHMEALKPDRLYDQKWIERERIFALISGLSQLEELQPIKPIVENIADLPTQDFVARLKSDLPSAVMARIDDWAVRRVPKETLSPEAVRQGNYNWYTWRYQQCTQTGTFFTGGIFPHARAEHVADCRATFAEEPSYATAKPWPVAKMLGDLKVPTIVVSGGRDPWMKVGVKPDHRYRNIEFVYFANGLHCPDVNGGEAGRAVFDKARKLSLNQPPR